MPPPGKSPLHSKFKASLLRRFEGLIETAGKAAVGLAIASPRSKP